MTTFVCRYPSETDLFVRLGDVFNEKEFRIAWALVPDMELVEVHEDNKIYNDRVSRTGWRDKWLSNPLRNNSESVYS